MRLSLLPSLLEKVYGNTRRGYRQFVVFELGKTHIKSLTRQGLPLEQPSLAVVWVDARGTGRSDRGAAYFWARHYLDYLLSSLGYGRPRVEPVMDGGNDVWLSQALAPLAAGLRGRVSLGGKDIGVLGEINAAAGAALKLPSRVAAFELNLGRLLELEPDGTGYRDPYRFPSVYFDVSFRAPKQVTYSKIADALAAAKASSKVDIGVELIDIYQKDANSRTYTWHLSFNALDRTLTQAEAKRHFERLVSSVAAKLNLEVV